MDKKKKVRLIQILLSLCFGLTAGSVFLPFISMKLGVLGLAKTFTMSGVDFYKTTGNISELLDYVGRYVNELSRNGYFLGICVLFAAVVIVAVFMAVILQILQPPKVFMFSMAGAVLDLLLAGTIGILLYRVVYRLQKELNDFVEIQIQMLPGFWLMLLFPAVIIAVSGFFIYKSLQLTGGKPIGKEPEPDRNRAPAANPKNQGTIIGISGEYSGASITISDGDIILMGRDALKCNLVLSNESVSEVHCGVTFHLKEQCYEIENISKRGIFIKSESGLKALDTKMLPFGTIFAVGSQADVFRLE